MALLLLVQKMFHCPFDNCGIVSKETVWLLLQILFLVFWCSKIAKFQ